MVIRFKKRIFFKTFFKIKLKRRRTSVFFALASNIAAFFIFLTSKNISQSFSPIRDPEFVASPSKMQFLQTLL